MGEWLGVRFGAWPSGKAPGFGPGIAGSNPAAPAGRRGDIVPGPKIVGERIAKELMSERGRGPIFAAVLAAGKGTRMKSNRAKVLHTICGVPMVN